MPVAIYEAGLETHPLSNLKPGAQSPKRSMQTSSSLYPAFAWPTSLILMMLRVSHEMGETNAMPYP